MAGLKLPGFELLALPMGPQLHLHRPLAQLRRRLSPGPVAELIGLYPPGLCKVVHIELEVSIPADQVITLMSIIVATETTEFALEMGGGHDLHKTVSIPGYFQT